MRNDTKGFTLIEMLVAVTLMLMLVLLLFQTFRNANEVGRRTQAWIEAHQNARSLFEFMERDLSGAILAGRKAGALGSETGKYFQMKDIQYDDVVGSGKGANPHEKDSIRLLSRTMNPGFAGDSWAGCGASDMAEVSYYLVENTGDTRKNQVKRYIDYVSKDPNGDMLKLPDPLEDVDYPGFTVWDPNCYKSFDVVAAGVTDLSLSASGGTIDNLTGSGWVSYDVVPHSVTITAYITESKGLFLYGNTRDNPFCGSGIKFIHTVLIGQK